MLARRAFIPIMSRGLRLLILMGVMALTACTWTELLDQPLRVQRIDITQVPVDAATAEPQTIQPQTIDDLDADDITGQWIGQARLDDGTRLYYELVLRQDGTEITGIAYGSDELGAASVDVNGTYEDGLLQLRESGGETSGQWEELCYWELDLQVTTRSSRLRIVGTLAGIPSAVDDCTHTGEIILSQQ